MHVMTYDPTDPHAIPAYDGDVEAAHKHLEPGSYPCSFNSVDGAEWTGELVVTPDGKFSHLVPVELQRTAEQVAAS